MSSNPNVATGEPFDCCEGKCSSYQNRPSSVHYSLESQGLRTYFHEYIYLICSDFGQIHKVSSTPSYHSIETIVCGASELCWHIQNRNLEFTIVKGYEGLKLLKLLSSIRNAMPLTLAPTSNCDICFEEFGQDRSIPCAIPCGHIYCVGWDKQCSAQRLSPLILFLLRCIARIKSCPLCRTFFSGADCRKLFSRFTVPSKFTMDPSLLYISIIAKHAIIITQPFSCIIGHWHQRSWGYYCAW